MTCRDCTKNKTTGSGNESCVWRIHPGYQKESASWTSDERKRNGINMWRMWSVKILCGLFVDAWNKGNTNTGRNAVFTFLYGKIKCHLKVLLNLKVGLKAN